MLGSGIFTTLFNQFVALLSAVCVNIAPGGGTPYIAAPAADPPTVAVRQQPLITRVISTQVNAGIDIGRVVAMSADRGTSVILAIPRDLVNALNEGGIAALPGGLATTGRRAVDGAQDSATDLVYVLRNIALSELDLLPGADRVATDNYVLAAKADTSGDSVDAAFIARQPLLVRVVTTQVDAVTSIGNAVLEATTNLARAILGAPNTIQDVIAKGGSQNLPAGLQLAARNIVFAASDGAIGIIQAAGDALRSELDLIPGGNVKASADLAKADFATSPNPSPIPAGLLELPIRVPLAFGVAGVDLLTAGLRAATQVTGGFATAAADIIRAAVNQFRGGALPGDTAALAVSRETQTLAQAIAQAPVTIGNGFADAGLTLQRGVDRARTDFRNTLNPRRAQPEARLSASGGANTTVNGTEVTATSGVSATAPTSNGSSSGGTPSPESTDATGTPTDSTGTATAPSGSTTSSTSGAAAS